MRISDWSSDVCSSDLPGLQGHRRSLIGRTNMSSGLIGAIILWLIVAVIGIAIVVYLLNWLYHRSTKAVSFVRTGYGGETAVINGGAHVLTIVLEVTPVNMNSLTIPQARGTARGGIPRYPPRGA